MDRKKNITILASIILFAALLLIAPYIVRFINGNTAILNHESSRDIRLIAGVDSGFIDPLYQSPITINIVYLLPALHPYWYLAINILLGLLSVWLFYLILIKHNVARKNIWAMLVLLITSPIFIHVFQGVNSYGICIFLTLAAILLLVENKGVISVVLFAVMPFINFYWALVSLILLIIYLVYNERTVKGSRYIIIFLILAMLASYFSNILLGNAVLGEISFSAENLITDIGANTGFSFSLVILSIIGLVLLWERGLKNVLVYTSIIFLVILSVWVQLLRIYLDFVLVIYAGFALIYLNRRKWSIQLIKKTTMLLILCSILFSTLFYITTVSRAEPSPELLDALAFLKQQSHPGEVVLCPTDLSYHVEYYSSLKTFANPETLLKDPAKEKIAADIAKSRNLENTEQLLSTNTIRYILIDETYRKYLEEQDGLLFIMETSNKFSQIYKNQKFEIWMYTS